MPVDDMTPDEPNTKPEPPIEELLASDELAEAIENDDYRRLLDCMPVGIAIARGGGVRERIVYANPKFASIIGQPLAEFVSADWSDFDQFRHEDTPTLTLGAAVRDGEDFLGTFRLDRPDAKFTLVQAYAGQVDPQAGTDTHRILAIIDVTDRERAQRDDAERRIRDKDMLLRELQHRVKNNLQLITALIRLEARTVRPDESGILARLAGRIESLALLYQTLSSDKFGDELDLGTYLSQIASAVVRTHTLPGIELELKVIYAPASINVAMPVGLLVNEMLTNAFKYAFTGRERGTVTIECRYEAQTGLFEICVADDGNGMPDGVVWPERGKLAALIMQTLRENTGGLTFEVKSGFQQGTRIEIAFLHQLGNKVH
ncbi:histidine kinase dimerization/phosphoacceptor domain -containing protein [Xanthobacteraceae bacterium Astr-EGSB]|uniref:sensor histidine kinase n=1 Tax=Astrobacterium formosum TaxID=3069710 RepID=UPI0027AE4EE5|nr:histidine kinase dimerization/phosphoacceptor domain -containing protein [Xanthobacteraceae bacterium Astr-EGSB]